MKRGDEEKIAVLWFKWGRCVVLFGCGLGRGEGSVEALDDVVGLEANGARTSWGAEHEDDAHVGCEFEVIFENDAGFLFGFDGKSGVEIATEGEGSAGSGMKAGGILMDFADERNVGGVEDDQGVAGKCRHAVVHPEYGECVAGVGIGSG